MICTILPEPFIPGKQFKKVSHPFILENCLEQSTALLHMTLLKLMGNQACLPRTSPGKVPPDSHSLSHK